MGEQKKMKSIKRTIVAVGLGFTLLSPGDGTADLTDGIRQVLASVNMSNRAFHGHVDEYGLPLQVFRLETFRAFVVSLSNQVATCSSEYVYGLTNKYERAVFLGALSECGVTAYTNILIRTLGGNPAQIPRDSQFVDDIIWMIGTRLEDYTGLHYDEPGISNVLNNAKFIFQETGATNEVQSMDYLMSGRFKRHREWMRVNGLQ